MPDVILAALSPAPLLFLLAGVIAGLVVGVMPGIGSVFALSLLIPFTTGFDVYSAMGLVIGITAVAGTSDTLPSVLLGVPGSAAGIATVEDGNPLARQGQAARALGAAYASSLIGGLFGALVLLAAIPVLRPIVLSLRSADFLAVSVFGLFFAASVSSGRLLKGILATLTGIMLSLIGLDAITGQERMTFGFTLLWDGLPFAIVLTGLFGLVELADLLARKQAAEGPVEVGTRGMLAGLGDTLREWRLVFGSSGIGVLLGMVPGIGVTTIDWVAYAIAKRKRNGGPAFGQGNIRGVIAPESANNAKEGGNLIPTLAIGLPGSVGMAFVISMLSVHGIAPGPEMLKGDLSLVYAIVIFVVLANVIGTLICLAATGSLARLASVPSHFVVPVVVALIVLGAYRELSHIFGIGLLVAMFIIGAMMKQARWPRAAFTLGFVLGPSIERYFFLSAQLSGAELLARPTVILVLALAGLLVWQRLRRSPLRLADFVLDAAGLPERLLLAIFACLAVAAGLQASGLRDQAGLFPMLVSGLFLLLALPSVRQLAKPLEATPRGELGALAASAICFTGLVYVAGPIAATAGFVSGFAWWRGERRLKLAAAVALGSAGAVFIAFELLQHVTWPQTLAGLLAGG